MVSASGKIGHGTVIMESDTAKMSKQGQVCVEALEAHSDPDLLASAASLLATLASEHGVSPVQGWLDGEN